MYLMETNDDDDDVDVDDDDHMHDDDNNNQHQHHLCQPRFVLSICLDSPRDSAHVSIS